MLCTTLVAYLPALRGGLLWDDNMHVTRADLQSLHGLWRIWFDLATVLIRRARTLYASDALGVELNNTVYALDSSTVDLCLSLFAWAPFRATKAAIKLHTLLDLRGCIPALICA